jgi:hypothetical protein
MKGTNTLGHTLAKIISSIHPNKTEVAVVNGKVGFIKTRREGMGCIILLGNLFLRAAGAGIYVPLRLDVWREREVRSYSRCNPGKAASVFSERAVFTERITGKAVSSIPIKSGIFESAVIACGRTMRELHSGERCLKSDDCSHGDPHLKNFIYDQTTDRCGVIDFETLHETNLEFSQRCADDMLTVCLGLIGKERGGISLAQTFISSYELGEAGCGKSLRESLISPRGMKKILWLTRCEFLPTGEMEGGVKKLRRWMETRGRQPLGAK